MNDTSLKGEYLKERLLTVKQFAARLGISLCVAKRMVYRREVHHFRIGNAEPDALWRDRRCVRIPESEVSRLAAFVERIPEKVTR